ncbi:RDAC family protein [Pseudoramibacter alactolyticus]
MANFTLLDAAALGRILKDRLGVELHIHDTCGDFFMTLDAPDDRALVFIKTYMAREGHTLTVDPGGTSFSVKA